MVIFHSYVHQMTLPDKSRSNHIATQVSTRSPAAPRSESRDKASDLGTSFRNPKGDLPSYASENWPIS